VAALALRRQLLEHPLPVVAAVVEAPVLAVVPQTRCPETLAAPEVVVMVAPKVMLELTVPQTLEAEAAVLDIFKGTDMGVGPEVPASSS
jgi:hypothetical protein